RTGSNLYTNTTFVPVVTANTSVAAFVTPSYKDASFTKSASEKLGSATTSAANAAPAMITPSSKTVREANQTANECEEEATCYFDAQCGQNFETKFTLAPPLFDIYRGKPSHAYCLSHFSHINLTQISLKTPNTIVHKNDTHRVAVLESLSGDATVMRVSPMSNARTILSVEDCGRLVGMEFADALRRSLLMATDST
ncbi:hypothetical protein OESDEN_15847, partial [Oesophagostomum dentatum]